MMLSPAFTLLLLFVGAIVGHEFIVAVGTYAELSGAAGGGGALAQGMNPLDGVLVPTFGAYDVAATFLLPFVVIRVFAAERATGAWTVLVQSPASIPTMIACKAVALALAWTLAMAPGMAAVAQWIWLGGHVHGAELGGLVLGHLLRAAFTVGLAATAAVITRQAASAAIVTLGVTVGSWALDFVAATRGGAWARIAAFSPTSALRTFEQGLVRVSTVSVMLSCGVAGLIVAGVWLDLSATRRERIRRTALVGAVLILVASAGAASRTSWDMTEDRRHSFPPSDDRALRSLGGPLRVEVHLGAEDPRLADLRRELFDRLERVVPRLDIAVVNGGGTGMFARHDPHYGEIWYEFAGRRVMLKSAIVPVVLQTIYDLAGAGATPAVADEYGGYPLAADPWFAWVLFFGVWPAVVVTTFWRGRRKGRR